MKPHTSQRLSACALACSLLIASSASASPLLFPQEAKGTLSKLIHPTPSSIASVNATEDLAEEVERLLWQVRSYDTLWNLGEAAVPGLQELTRSCSLSRLIDHNNFTSPFFWLSEISPEAAMGTHLALSESDPERFRLIVRRGLGAFGSNENRHTEGTPEKAWERPTAALSAAARSFLSAVLMDSEIPLDQKLDVFSRAFELGVSTQGSDALVQANLDLAAPHLGTKGLRHFALKDLAKVPSDLSEPLALRVLESLEPSVTVPALTDSPHPRVRAEAFAKARSSGFDRAVSITLLIAHKDETSPTVQRAMLELMGHRGLPNFTDGTLEQLVPLVDFALRHQAMLSKVSERLTNVVVSRLEQADASDAPIVRDLVRTIFDQKQPPIYLHFGSQGVSHRIRSAAIALAIVEGASGAAHQPDSLIQEIANAWIQSDKAPTHPESANLLYAIYSSFQPTDHKESLPRNGLDLAALPPDLAPGALEWLGQTDSRYDRVAAISPRHWTGAIDALQASAFGEARPWQERCIAMGALLHQPKVADEDVDRIAGQLGANLNDPEAQRQFFTYLNEGSDATPLSHAWNRVVEKLFASPKVSKETTERLFLVDSARTEAELDVVSRILKLAAARVDASTQSAQYTKLVAIAVKEEVAHRAANGPLIPETLLANWIDQVLPSSKQHRDGLMAVVLLRGDVALEDRALMALSQQVRVVSSRQARSSLVNAILQLPGESPERTIVALAPLYLSSDERDTAYANIRSRREAQVLQEEFFGEKATALPTRESALAQVLALLEDDQESIRIEAIRGLGTLGAVETLPRLIALLGSGSQAEQAAARETLDLLRRMAEFK